MAGGRPSIIVDEQEARDLIAAGYTNSELVEYYRKRYGKETSRASWARARKRFQDPEAAKKARGGSVADKESTRFIPWQVKPNPKGLAYFEALLTLNEINLHGSADLFRELKTDERLQARVFQLERVRQDLQESESVITYDNERNEFVPVPRRKGIDYGWIREPYWDDNGVRIPIKELEDYLTPLALMLRYPTDMRTWLPPTGDKELLAEYIRANGPHPEYEPGTQEKVDEDVEWFARPIVKRSDPSMKAYLDPKPIDPNNLYGDMVIDEMPSRPLGRNKQPTSASKQPDVG